MATYYNGKAVNAIYAWPPHYVNDLAMRFAMAQHSDPRTGRGAARIKPAQAYLKLPAHIPHGAILTLQEFCNGLWLTANFVVDRVGRGLYRLRHNQVPYRIQRTA